MAVEALKSTPITNLDTIPALANTSGEGGVGLLRQLNAHATPSASASATSTYQLVRLPTFAKVKEIIFESAAQGAGKFDLGVWYSSSTVDGTAVSVQGTVVSGKQDFFASDIDCASAVAATNVTNESGNYTVDKRNQPLWQAAGLSSDPGGMLDIVATVHTTAVTTGTGKIAIDVRYTL